jgi:hypothetical protein
MHQVLADLQSHDRELGARPVVASPNDRHQAQNPSTSKHKQIKHGKKGGKRHK